MQTDSFISLLFSLSLSIIESTSSAFSKMYLNFCLFFFFSQTLSPFFKLHYHEFDDVLSTILANVFYFSNFSTLIYYIKSQSLFYLFYIVAFLMIFTPIFYVFFEGIFKYFFEKTVSKKNIIRKFTVAVVKAWNWFLVIPILDILTNPFECEWYTFSKECTVGFSRTLYVLSVIGIIFAIFLQLFLVFMSKSFYFLDNGISFEGNIFRCLIFLLRDFQVILFFVFKEQPLLYDLIIHLIALFSLFDLIYYKAMKHFRRNEVYVKYLCAFESINILLFFWRFTPILNDVTLFYSIMILLILSFKLGSNFPKLSMEQLIFYWNCNNQIDVDVCKLMEKIKFYELKAKNKKKHYFILFGYLKSHFKRKEPCSEHCEFLKSSFWKNPVDFVNSSNKINSFIRNHLDLSIMNKQLAKNIDNKSEIRMKYLDFFKNNCNNSKELLFELEKNKFKMKNEENSFYIAHLIMNFSNFIKEKALKETNLLSYEDKEQALNIRNFITMVKYNKKITNEIKDLLKRRKKFWENYYIGYKEMDKFISNIQDLTMKIDNFKNFLSNNLNNPIVRVLIFKAFTFLDAIMFNKLGNANYYEEEYYKLFKNELIASQNVKAKLSFIDQNIIVCEASFLNLDGKIKPDSKTKKFCDFFGYSLSDLHIIEYIEDLMPEYIASKHKKFVENYFKRPISSTFNKYPIKTFAVHKNEYLIPICIYISQKYTHNDVALVAAMIYDEMNDEIFIEYSGSGEIFGISKKMLDFFINNIPEFRLHLFKNKNLFDYAPNLKEISLNNSSIDFLMNQRCILSFPMISEEILSTHSLIQTNSQKKTKSFQRKMKRFLLNFTLKIQNNQNEESEVKELAFHMAITDISCINDDLTINESISSLMIQKNYGDEENVNDISNISERENPHILIIKKENNVYKSEILKNNSFDKKTNIDLQKMQEEQNNQIMRKKTFELKKEEALTDDLNSKNFHFKEKDDAISQNSSVLKAAVLNSKVFVGIEKIKKYVPKNFYFFLAGVILECLLLMIYSIIYSKSIDQYFSDKFYPSQNGLIHFCEQYTGIALSSAITLELEYQRLNLIKENLQNPFYNEFYYRILLRNFYLTKEIVYEERDYPQTLNYQYIYQNEPTYMANPEVYPLVISVMHYFDYLEYNLNYLKSFYYSDYKTMNYLDLIFLQRNYPLYLIPSAKIYSAIQQSFLSDSIELQNYLTTLMIIFLVLMGTVKIFEIIQIFYLYEVVNKLGLVFLRNNQFEALREIKFTEMIIEDVENSSNFINCNFVEKALAKRDKFPFLERNQTFNFNKNKKNKEKVKNYKKQFSRSNLNISPLKKKKGVIFVSITIIFSFCFYFLNNLFWTSITSDIQQVISLDVAFSDIYVYATSILLCNNVYLREMIISNPEYEATNNYYQTPKGRKTYLMAALNKRIRTVQETFDNQMLKSVTISNSTIKDKNFQLIINNNVCEALLNMQLILNDEKNLCNEIWSGAFRKGIMLASRAFISQMNEINDLRVQIDDTNSKEYSKLLNNIQTYIEDPKHQELFFGEYFLCKALLLLYGYINQYYNPLIENEKNNNHLSLFLTMGFMEIFLIFSAFFIAKFMKVYYKYLSLSLSVMPYEKITGDEATSQIINNFTKKR